jgi:hypothetical protein
MSVTNVTIPTAQSFLLVDTRTGPNKVLFLPTASTIQGRYLSIKDYYGNATASTLTISTTGLDRIDQRGIRYTLASSFGSVMLLSDGLRSWNMLGLYEGGDTALATAGAATVTAFSYTGANQTYTVPAGVTSIQVYMWGAGGGGKNAVYGGAGAMIQGVLTVTPGETLNIVVGGGGPAPTTTLTSAYGGGGAQGIGDGGQSGGGGGRSAIQRGGTAVTDDIVVAGAGGGGTFSAIGGAATFSGTANNGGSTTVQGFGGTQSAGGAGGAAGTYGTGTAGSRGQGGSVVNPISASSNDGGGGGAGYYGGGGGGTNLSDAGGGGGGSSFTGNLSLIPGQSVLGFNSTNGYSAPNAGSIYYSAGVGSGAANAAGGNGRIVIVFGGAAAAAPSGPVSWQYVRFSVVLARGQYSGREWQMSEFTLKYQGSPVSYTGATISPVVGGGEDNPNLIDGNLGNKAFNTSTSFTIFRASGFLFDAYTWATANDVPDRDPVRWILDASQDNATWTVLDNKSTADQTITTNRNTYVQDFTL